MKKWGKITGLAVLLALLVAMAAGCGASEKKLVGHWEPADGESCHFRYIYFYSDGTYSTSSSNYQGTYTAENGNLRLSGYLADDYNATYWFEGDELIIHRGWDDRYQRVS